MQPIQDPFLSIVPEAITSCGWVISYLIVLKIVKKAVKT